MAEITDIQNLLLVADGYMLELGEQLYAEQVKGCTDCFDASKIEQLLYLSDSLYHQLERNDYGKQTDALYACLLSAVANYSGASISVDPNSSIPNTNIYVTIVSDGRPDWKDIDWSQMTNDVDGYRDTFFSPDLIGLNPSIEREGTVMYRVGIEYDNDGLGTIKFKEGFGFYSGQYFRMGNYQQYTAPTPSYPPAGTYRLVNNSTIDTSYYISSSIPLTVEQIVNSQISLGESLLGLIQVGQKLNFNRYFSDGTIDLHLELANPPATQLSTGVMDLSKSYEFIYTDNEVDDFNFSDLVGLQLWYDTTDDSTISQSSSRVTQIRDKSGNNNHSNPTANQRPTVAINSETGKQIFVMDGSENFLPMTSQLDLQDFSLYILVRVDSPGFCMLMGASDRLEFFSYNTFLNITQAGGITNKWLPDKAGRSFGVISIRRNGSLISAEIDGRTQFFELKADNSNTLKIGQLMAVESDYVMQGIFGGAVLYNSFISDSDSLKVIKKLFDINNVNPTSTNDQIIGFGDSVTNGYGLDDPNTESFLNRIGVALNKKASDAGREGTPFQNTGNAFRNGYNRYPTDLLEYNYTSSVYILYGTNDVGGAAMGGSVEIYRNQLSLMVGDMISLGYLPSNIYLGTVPYRKGDDLGELTRAYGEAVRSVALEHHTKFADIYQDMVDNGADSLLQAGFPQVHPNALGHEVITNSFLNSIQL